MKKKRFAKFIVIFSTFIGLTLIIVGVYLFLRDYYINPDKELIQKDHPEEEFHKFSLPFHASNLVDSPPNFGIIPFGLKNETYPAGNLGWDFELYKGTEILSVNGGEIIEIKESQVVPETYTITIIYDSANIIYYELSNVSEGLKKGSKVSRGDLLGETGYVLSEDITILHIEVKKDSETICPFPYFSEDAKKEIQLLLSRSINNETKKPFESLCIKN